MSINDLQQWRPGLLGEVADTLSNKRKKLVDLQDEIDGAQPPPSWVAGAAGKARTTHQQLRLRLLDLAAEVSDVTVNLDDAQNRLTSAKQSLEDALGAAAAKGFEVDKATGVVKDPRTYLDALERNAVASEVSRIAGDIAAALQLAQEADLDLAKALISAADGAIEGGSGTLDDAVNQLPTRMDALTPEQLADLLGDDVSIHTISAFLEVEAELATWEIEGKAQADYKVMADGTVVMALHLEAGLGREIEVAGTEADIGAGGTTDLELTFDSPAEAQKFLDGLDDAAMDIGLGDALTGAVPAKVASNVAAYVMEQDISSFRTGVYAAGEVEFDQPWARGAVEGRAEAYYDWVADQYGVKLDAKVAGEVGGANSGYEAAASLSGEVKISDNGDFESLTLSGRMEATVANERLGIAMPAGTSTGGGVDVQLMVDKDNPALEDIKTALSNGELDRAKDLALDNGQLVVRQTVLEEYASGEHEFDIKVAEAEVKYGASGETAVQIWFREAGHREVLRIDPAQLPVNQGG